jgi:hypothetical protein
MAGAKKWQMAEQKMQGGRPKNARWPKTENARRSVRQNIARRPDQKTSHPKTPELFLPATGPIRLPQTTPTNAPGFSRCPVFGKVAHVDVSMSALKLVPQPGLCEILRSDWCNQYPLDKAGRKARCVKTNFPKTGGGGELRIFSENRGRPVAFFV